MQLQLPRSTVDMEIKVKLIPRKYLFAFTFAFDSNWTDAISHSCPYRYFTPNFTFAFVFVILKVIILEIILFRFALISVSMVHEGPTNQCQLILHNVFREPFGSWTSAPKIVDVHPEKGCSFFAYSWKLPAYSGAFLLTNDNFSFCWQLEPCCLQF